jgi:hypothetical protein
MVAPFIKRLRSLQQRMPAQYVSPVMLLLGTCFVSIFLLLFFSTRTQDVLQRERETEALQSVLHNATDMTKRDLQDYAQWDDAVRHIGREIDDQWVSDNISAYLGTTQGYSHIFVLDGANRTAYSYKDGGRDPAPDLAQRRLGRDLVKVVASPSRVKGEQRAQIVSLVRPKDGLTWGLKGEKVD